MPKHLGEERILTTCSSYMTTNGGVSPDDAIGQAGAQILLADIADMRTTLASLNLPKTIPVGTSEAGAFFNTDVLKGIDYGMSNVHAWFANTTAKDAAPWTADFFQHTNVDVAKLLPNNPTMYIAETGWPTVGVFRSEVRGYGIWDSS
jgi:exo-beta-1,3-glucanase (GH17 family)